MSGILVLIGFFVVWIILVRFVFPRLGIHG
jgi:hypothetical protein